MRPLMLVVAIATFHPMLIRAADAVSWGQPANGLRVGVAVTPRLSTGKLRLALQNVGASGMDVLLGGKTGIGTMYTMKFGVSDPSGNERQLFYFGGANSVGGYLEPLLIRVVPGETYDLWLPLNKFVCVLNRKNLTLDTLLKDHYSVRASLDVSAESAKWATANAPLRGHRHGWTGKVASGELRLSK